MREKRHTLNSLLILLLWISWLLIGTSFYAIFDEMGWSRGFYMAVNVGYSIGWGYPEELRNWMDWFSICFLLIGASAVAILLISAADSQATVNREWFERAINEHKWEQRKQRNKWRYWVHEEKQHLLALLYWVIWIFIMTTWSMFAVGWSFVEGLYFAISSCSTGGLKPIPNDSPDSYFVIVGALTAIGVPLMGYAMGHGAMLLKVISQEYEDVEAIVDKELTIDELRMFVNLGFKFGDDQLATINNTEFIILCAMRLGALTPKLIDTINRKFRQLLEEAHQRSELPVHILLTPRKIAAEMGTLHKSLHSSASQSTSYLNILSSSIRKSAGIKPGTSLTCMANSAHTPGTEDGIRNESCEDDDSPGAIWMETGVSTPLARDYRVASPATELYVGNRKVASIDNAISYNTFISSQLPFNISDNVTNL